LAIGKEGYKLEEDDSLLKYIIPIFGIGAMLMVIQITVGNASSEKENRGYFPSSESQGGWRKLENPDDIRQLARMDPDKLDQLKQWLKDSDNRNFATVVVR
jgi:hypothetical protein